MPKILFICTANICRSPMASAIMNEIVNNKYNKRDWQIESAGTWGQEGYRVVDEVLVIMRNRGIDLSSHRSRIISQELMQYANLVLTMEKGHKEALRMEFPEFSERTYLLSEMIEQDFDIDDPIGGSRSQYEQTAKLLEMILLQGFEKINQLVEPSSHSRGFLFLPSEDNKSIGEQQI